MWSLLVVSVVLEGVGGVPTTVVKEDGGDGEAVAVVVMDAGSVVMVKIPVGKVESVEEEEDEDGVLPGAAEPVMVMTCVAVETLSSAVEVGSEGTVTVKMGVAMASSLLLLLLLVLMATAIGWLRRGGISGVENSV